MGRNEVGVPNAKAARIEKVSSLDWDVVSGKQSLWDSLARPVRDIFAKRRLLLLLIDRELRAKYKGSAFGILWSLARPLSLLLIYFLVIGQFLGAARGIPGFAVFVYIGITAWTLFSETTSQSSHVILSNAGIIKKVDVPRELFPLSVVGVGFINFCIQLAVLCVVVIALGQSPQLVDLPYALPATFILLAFSIGISYLVSAINVFVRDLQHLVDVAMALLFWVSPIVYSYRFVSAALGDSWLLSLYLSNPISIAIMGFQRGLWSAGSGDPTNFPPDLGLRLIVMAGVSVVVLMVGQVVFSRLQRNFAQEI